MRHNEKLRREKTWMEEEFVQMKLEKVDLLSQIDFQSNRKQDVCQLY